MKYSIYLTKKQKAQLEFEVLSLEFYSYLIRLLLKQLEEHHPDGEKRLIIMNRIVNHSSLISGNNKIYTLVPDDDGNYYHVEYAWHESKFLLIFDRLSIVQFIEVCCELLERRLLKLDLINDALKEEGASFRFKKPRDKPVEVSVFDISEIESSIDAHEHPNIRILVARMDNLYKSNDYAGVLHSSASIFETMAKDIIGVSSIQHSTLGSFFERYRKDSKLPKEILDYILDTYNNRNATPLAGHGSLSAPDISKEEAIILIELTKVFVKIEYLLLMEGK